MDTITAVGLVALGLFIGAFLASVITLLFYRQKHARERLELESEYRFVVANLNAANDKYALKLSHTNELEQRLEKSAKLISHLEISKATLETEAKAAVTQSEDRGGVETELTDRLDQMSETQKELHKTASQLSKMLHQIRGEFEDSGAEEKALGSLELVAGTEEKQEVGSLESFDEDLEGFAEEFEKEFRNIRIADAATGGGGGR